MQLCFVQLRDISKICSFLSHSGPEKVISVFISSRLDDCNALFSGISHCNLHRLQLSQNAAPGFHNTLKKNTTVHQSFQSIIGCLVLEWM